MEGKDYWGYWINVVQELRVRVNELEKRVKELESRKPAAVQLGSPKSMTDLAKSGTPDDNSLSEKELAACIALKELGKPSGVDEVNDHLRKTRKIDESIKETLFLRLKGAMEKGYVGFDQKDKKFMLVKQDFVVG
jgi:hypothetical protein